MAEATVLEPFPRIHGSMSGLYSIKLGTPDSKASYDIECGVLIPHKYKESLFTGFDSLKCLIRDIPRIRFGLVGSGA